MSHCEEETEILLFHVAKQQVSQNLRNTHINVLNCYMFFSMPTVNLAIWVSFRLTSMSASLHLQGSTFKFISLFWSQFLLSPVLMVYLLTVTKVKWHVSNWDTVSPFNGTPVTYMGNLSCLWKPTLSCPSYFQTCSKWVSPSSSEVTQLKLKYSCELQLISIFTFRHLFVKSQSVNHNCKSHQR